MKVGTYVRKRRRKSEGEGGQKEIGRIRRVVSYPDYILLSRNYFPMVGKVTQDVYM